MPSRNLPGGTDLFPPPPERRPLPELTYNGIEALRAYARTPVRFQPVKSELLVTGFLRRLLDLHLELIDEIERKLAPKQTKGRSAGRR